MNDIKENVQYDLIGEKTLELLSNSPSFNFWMYKQIKPYISGKVIEIGSGIGNISKYILDDFQTTLSDNNQTYCSYLLDKFKSHKNFNAIRLLDVTNKSDFIDSKSEKYDTVILLNVIEHIWNDQKALENLCTLLSENGKIIILTPANPWLFSKFDQQLGHYRRYTNASISKLVYESGLSLTNRFYFNFLGILGWFVFGKILKQEQIQQKPMQIFNLLMPINKLIQPIAKYFSGLSIVAIVRSPKEY
jgi:SAM-dependent methyltransferase